jgi:hypothetical protein
VPALRPFDRCQSSQRVDHGLSVTLAEDRRHRQAADELFEFLGVDVGQPVECDVWV